MGEKVTGRFRDGEDKDIGVEVDMEIKVDLAGKERMNRSTDAKSVDLSSVEDKRVNRSCDNNRLDYTERSGYS